MAEQAVNQQVNPDINQLLPSDLIAEDEEVVFAAKPSLWSIAFLSFRTVVVAGAISVLAMILGPILHLGLLSLYIIEFCGLAAMLRVGFAFLQWVSRSYVLTNRRVIRIRGVFTIDIFQCSLGRLQNTFLILTLPQRFFNLGNIEFTTAGGVGIEAVWRHCRDPLKIHQQLIRAINRAQNHSSATGQGL
jgi:hypothetical protein